MLASRLHAVRDVHRAVVLSGAVVGLLSAAIVPTSVLAQQASVAVGTRPARTRIAAGDSVVLTVVLGAAPDRTAPTSGASLPAVVSMESPAGTFRVETDWGKLAAWADAAEALPGPTPGEGGKLEFHGTVLRPPSGRPDAMRLLRLSGDSAADYHLAAGNGAWEDAVRLRAGAARAFFRALRGLPVTDTAALAPPVNEPLRDGDEVDVPVSPAANNPLPTYPPALSRARVEGSAMLRFVFGTDGRPQRVTLCVLESSAPEFALAARDAVLAWRYTPARRNGVAVAQLVVQPFTFALTR